jgi:hypothetical protein
LEENNNHIKILPNKSIDDEQKKINNEENISKVKRNNEEQNSLYKNFVLNTQKGKSQSNKKPKTSKTIYAPNRHPENAYKTTIVCKSKSLAKIEKNKNKNKNKKNIFTNIYQKTNNEESNYDISFNNTNYNYRNKQNKKLGITITNSNSLIKNAEFNKNLNDKIYNTLSYRQNNDIISQYNGFSDDDNNKETAIEDNNDEKLERNINSKKYGFSTGKKNNKIKQNNWKDDRLNPYLTNWANSFLRIGYNVGFHYNEFQEGVPLLRIQKLKKKK